MVVRSGQRVFSEIIEAYLHRIAYDDGDGYARLIRLPPYERAEVVADPEAPSVSQSSLVVALVSVTSSTASGAAMTSTQSLRSSGSPSPRGRTACRIPPGWS